MMRHGTTAEKTIIAMRSVFSRLGMCEQIVSDNGPPFPSKELQDYLQSNGIKAIFSAPYHPASNGAAERFVKTLKRGLKKSAGKSKLHKLHEFLLTYRSTPHSVTGQTPSELLLGRRIRTRLDLVRPDRRARISRQSQGVQHPRAFVVGDLVIARDYRNVRKPGWVQGVIVSQASPVTYQVQVEVGNEVVVWKRHVDQLRACEGERNDVDGMSFTRDPVVPSVVGPQMIRDSLSVAQTEDAVTGGRAPTGPPRPEVVEDSAVATPTVVCPDLEVTDVPAATRILPAQNRRPPAYLKDYERY